MNENEEMYQVILGYANAIIKMGEYVEKLEGQLEAKDDQIEIFKITANQQIDKAIDLKGQLEAKNKDVAFLKWNVEKWNARWKELYGKLEAIRQIVNKIDWRNQVLTERGIERLRSLLDVSLEKSGASQAP